MRAALCNTYKINRHTQITQNEEEKINVYISLSEIVNFFRALTRTC